MESEMSDDYAIPPDAFASETNSMDIALSSGCQNLTLGSTTSVNFNSTVSLLGASANSIEGSPRKESLEKSGYLTKLGGKLKTWRKRWFVLKNGTLTYWKSSVSFCLSASFNIFMPTDFEYNNEGNVFLGPHIVILGSSHRDS